MSWWIVVGLERRDALLGFVTTSRWALETAGRVADEFRDEDASRAPERADARDDAAQVLAG